MGISIFLKSKSVVNNGLYVGETQLVEEFFFNFFVVELNSYFRSAFLIVDILKASSNKK